MKFLNLIKITDLTKKLKKVDNKFGDFNFSPNDVNNKLFFSHNNIKYVYTLLNLFKDIENDEFYVLKEVYHLITVFLDALKETSKIKIVKEFSINEV